MEKRKLLIIEPDVFERDVFSKVFSDLYEIKFTINVNEATETIKEYQPSALIYDMPLTDMGSFRKLNEANSHNGNSIPLILIVSDNSLEFERMARENRVFYYLIKPFDFKELSEAIHSATCFAIKNNLAI